MVRITPIMRYLTHLLLDMRSASNRFPIRELKPETLLYDFGLHLANGLKCFRQVNDSKIIQRNHNLYLKILAEPILMVASFSSYLIKFN